jgi:hypothetical protein
LETWPDVDLLLWELEGLRWAEATPTYMLKVGFFHQLKKN